MAIPINNPTAFGCALWVPTIRGTAGKPCANFSRKNHAPVGIEGKHPVTIPIFAAIHNYQELAPAVRFRSHSQYICLLAQ